MKILESHERSDRIAVLRINDLPAILDATDATCADVEKFVDDNIRRYNNCEILGVYDATFDSPTPSQKKKPSV